MKDIFKKHKKVTFTIENTIQVFEKRKNKIIHFTKKRFDFKV